MSRAIVRWLLALGFLAAGIAHLRVPDVLMMITPAWVPWPHAVIIATGFFEIAAAAALALCPPLRRWAGIGLAIYSLCVWPANFKHAIDGIDLPYIGSSLWYHVPRLALQPVIIWLALWCGEVTDWPKRRA